MVTIYGVLAAALLAEAVVRVIRGPAWLAVMCAVLGLNCAYSGVRVFRGRRARAVRLPRRSRNRARPVAVPPRRSRRPSRREPVQGGDLRELRRNRRERRKPRD